MKDIFYIISLYIGAGLIITIILWAIGYFLLKIINYYSKIFLFFVYWIPQIKKNPYNVIKVVKDGNGKKWAVVRYDDKTKKLLEKQQELK